MGVFLTAEWRDLLLLNYAVPDDLLVPYLPPGLELDRMNGSAWVSLVAFDFLDTKVFGVKWPGYVDFVEVNLRFYVRHGNVRGVVFIREFVPKRLVAWIARALYNEPYAAAPVRSESKRSAGLIEKSYSLRWRGTEHRLQAKLLDQPWRPATSSDEHFFKEHEWGFGRSRTNALVSYRVEHPCWDVYPLKTLETSFDFGAVYGAQWSLLNKTKPDSAVFAAGSKVQVFSKS